MDNHNGKSLKYAWYVIFVLTLANVSSFIDRQILALLVAPIKRDLHLSDTEISLLMGFSFAIFYTLFGVFIGHFADKFNRRNIIVAGITVWSMMTALCGGVHTYLQFFLARIGVGVGEATLAPSAYSMIADYFPKDKLSRALSVYSMGIFIGSGLAILIGAGLISALPTSGTVHVPIFGDIFHWQMLFIYIGLPGLIIGLLLLTVKEPIRRDDKGISDIKPTLKESLSIINAKRKVYLLICVAAAFTAFLSYGSSAWIPTYFNRTFGWQMKEVGLKFGLIMTIFSTLGVLSGGFLADNYNKKNILDGKIRVGLIAGIFLFLSAFIFLLSDPNIILLALSVPIFFISFPFGASVAAIQEMMPNRARALSGSIFLFFVNIIGMGGGPFLVAFFTDSVFHDEKMIKYSIIALYLIGGFMITLLYYLARNPFVKEIENSKIQ
ncbi:MAG: MFS transporter [Saprospiraceae bacterium]|nr:MFS transporter [Saprospiraceae bacterium]